MNPLRVLQVSNQLGLGGTDATLQVLATHVNRQYFEVFAAGIDHGGAREQTLREQGIPTIVCNGDLEKVAELVRSQHIDVIHLHHCHLPLHVLSGCKVALTHQFSTCVYDREQELRFARLLFNSTRTLQKYLSTYAIADIPANAEIIYNPIDLTQVRAVQASISAKEVADYRRALGLEPDAFVIGRLGRAEIVKWSDFLIEALRPLLKSDGAIKVLIQTAPPSRTKRLEAEFGNSVVVLPESSSPRDLALFFSALDVYAHASKIGESFGVSIAEAMAFKKPVVVNSTPGVDNAQIELVDNDSTGYVVEYPISFARAIQRLREDRPLREQMGEAGYAKVKAKYSADSVTAQYEHILFNMMGVSNEPEMTAYVSSLTPPISHADMQRSFVEYQRRLKDTFGAVSTAERVAYRMRFPLRFLGRISDYLEYRRQLRAQRERSG